MQVRIRLILGSIQLEVKNVMGERGRKGEGNGLEWRGVTLKARRY